MNKKEWGNAMWYFMHTFAYKLNEEFSHKAKEIMVLYYNICINTPCPDCSEHAKQILNKLNMNKIKRKDDLIRVMFEFHNIVNERLNKPKFNMEELNDKYKRANTLNISNHFFKIMKGKINNERAMIYTLNRKIALQKVYNYIHKNNNYFMK
jgi:hypothetical protein